MGDIMIFLIHHLSLAFKCLYGVLAEVGILISGIELINVNLKNSGPKIFGIYIYKLNSQNPNCHLWVLEDMEVSDKAGDGVRKL